jgi:hypothetical protein
MAGAKLIVIYPRPKDTESFERVYLNEHVPMAVEKLASKNKIVASKIVGSGQGTPHFHRVVEIHFPTNEGSGSVHRIGRRQTDDRQCGSDFFRGRTDFPGRRRRSICVLADQPRMTALDDHSGAVRALWVIHSLVGNISPRAQF